MRPILRSTRPSPLDLGFTETIGEKGSAQMPAPFRAVMVWRFPKRWSTGRSRLCGRGCRSPDRTGVCRAGRSEPSRCEKVTGPRFSSPNQPDQERTTAYRDSSGPNSRSDAHCATNVGDWARPSGESRFKQGETDLGDKGKKDKGKREQQKKAQLNPKQKRKQKKEKKK